MVIAVIIGVVAAIVVNMITYKDMEAHVTYSSTMYNFEDLFWLIPGAAGLVVVIVAAKLIMINVKRKK